MDYQQKGYLTPDDFNRFLTTNGVFYPADLDIQALFSKFDTRGRNKVTFSDFYEEMSVKIIE